MTRRVVSGTARFVIAALGLTLLVGACSDGEDGLDLITDDEQSEVQVGDDQAPPDVAADNESANVSTDDGSASGASASIDDETTPTDDNASNGSSDSAGSDSADSAGSDSAGSNSSGSDSADSGGAESEGPPPPVDDDIEDADVPLSADPATADRADVAYPATTVTDLGSGAEVPLAAQLADRDKRTLLWFWAPDAGPSSAEAATVQRLSNEQADTVDVIAIGTGGERATAEQFLADTGLTTTAVLWDAGADAAEHYSIEELPTSVLLDRNGDIIARWSTLSPEVFDFLAILP